jgi:hypothetical protein
VWEILRKITSFDTQDSHMYTKDKYWHGAPREEKKMDFIYPWRWTQVGKNVSISVSRFSLRILLI